jgi:antitoxin YefM
MDRACEDRAPKVITRSGRRDGIVMLSLAEYDQLEDTAFLFRSPANARRLLHAMNELPRAKGKE